MTENQGPDNQERVPATRRPLRRPRENRILGGVCAAIAQYFGLDPVVVRLVTVALAVVSGGGVALAYLIAWVLIPPAGVGSTTSGETTTSGQTAPEATPARAPVTGAREAWNVVGSDVRTLAADLRPHATGKQGTSAEGYGATAGRAAEGRHSPVKAVDATFTAIGERVRDPKVRADARRAAEDLSTAVGATAKEVGRRGHRNGGTSQ